MNSPILFQGRRFRVERVLQPTAEGHLREREVVRHPGAVTILPLLDDGRVCMIHSYRVSVDKTLIELPAGTLEPGEDPRATAERELIEETGYRCAKIELLHAFYLSPGILDERMHLYLATGLTPGPTAREEGELIENLVLPLEEALALIDRGEIQDAKTIAGLLYYARKRGLESHQLKLASASTAAPRSVEVATPLRLHFGLFSFGASGRQFGGVGVMAGLAGPRVRLTAADKLSAVAASAVAIGDSAAGARLAERALGFARRWAESQGWPSEPLCKIELLSSPPEHVGLGVGTQLALAVAAGLNVLFDRPTPSPAELAMSVGRGLRSAVGTYGFAHGGLVVEQGKLPGELVSPLDCQLDLPDEWRFALIRARAGTAEIAGGLAGAAEQEAFSQLPPVPLATTAELIAEVQDRLVPAAAQGQFDEFSDSVYQFGHLAGRCFAARQGGPYHGPLLTELVAAIRQLGVRGVGQSSWGPTLFAVLPSEAPFAEFAAHLSVRFPEADLAIELVEPNNRGASVISNF